MKHTMMKVLSVVLALTMIMGTFGMVVFATECDHENCAETKVPATCGTYGYTLYECEDCGYSYAANLIAKADECNPDSAVEIPAKEATCGPDGDGAYTAGSYCGDCGAILVAPELIEGSEIECVPEVVLIPATCDKPYNEVKLVCAVCETEYGTANLDDNWANTLFDGDGKHNYAYEITVEPTCVKNGTAVVYCEQCDIEEREIRVLKNDTLHNWKDVSVAATCTTEGKLGFECDNEGCDAVAGKDEDGNVVVDGYIKTLPATGHNIVVPALEDLTDGCTAVEVAATCTENGYTHWYCDNEGCPVYAEIQHEVLAAAHQWPFTVVDGEVRDIEYGAYYTIGTVHDCITDRVDTYKCKVCGEEETRVGAAALGHDEHYLYNCTSGCAVNACTDCTHTGRTVTKSCLNANCPVAPADLADPSAPVSAAKHAWLYGEVVPGTCVDFAYNTGYCTNAGCTAVLAPHEEEIPASKGGHSWVYGPDVPGTCVSPAYKTGTCALCYVDIEPGSQPIADTINSENHAGTVTDRGVVVVPTCSTEGYGLKWCDACCSDKLGDGIDDSDYIKYEVLHTPDLYISLAAQASTCSVAGWTEEWSCRACGEVTTASVALDLAPHGDVRIGDVAQEADCVTKKVWNALCYDCGAECTVEGTVDLNKHAALVYVPYKAANCLDAGNHAYIACDACDNVVFIAEDQFGADKTFEDISAGFGANDPDVDDCDIPGCYHEDATIPALGHDNETFAAKKETCTTHGMIGGTICKRCGVKSSDDAGKVIVPHGKFNGTDYVFDPEGFFVNADGDIIKNYVITDEEAKAPTCTEEGAEADEYCMICHEGNLSAHVLDKVAHSMSTYRVEADCTNAGYTVHFCENCETISETFPDSTAVDGVKEVLVWYIDDYTKANGHNYVDFSVAGDCVTTAKTGKVCVECGAEADVKYGAAAKGHKVGSEYVDLSCAGIAAYVGTECSVCGHDIEIEDMTHNIFVGENAPTCTEPGALIFKCVDCGLYFIDEEGSRLTPGIPGDADRVEIPDGSFDIEIPKTGHSVGLVVEFVLPTKFTAGYVVFQCAVCNEVMDPIELYSPVYESELTLDLEVAPYNTAIGAYEGVAVNTGKIAVTLNLSAEAFEYKILNLKFGFDTTKLAFAGYTVNYEFDVTQGVETKAYATGGYVNVISRSTTPDTVEEVAPNVMIEGEDIAFITLFFTVKRDMAPHNFENVTDVDNSVWVIEDAIDFMKVTEEGLTNETEKCDFIVDNDFALEVYSLGDVSYDNEINLGDLVALTDLLYTADAEYSATADINRDGVINIVDIALLENYLLTNRNYEDYIAMVG